MLPVGANPFFLEWPPFRKGRVQMKANRKSEKLSPLGENLPSLSSPLNSVFYPKVQTSCTLIFLMLCMVDKEFSR